MIYAQVVRTGHLALFSTSKRIRQEGALSVFQHLQFKVTIGDTTLPTTLIPTPLRATSFIQDLYLTIFVKYTVLSNANRQLIEYFSGSYVTRKNCCVVFVFKTSVIVLGSLNGQNPNIQALKTLTRFENLSVELCGVFRHFTVEYRELEKALAPELGPGIQVVDHTGYPRLEFQPYGFSKAKAQSLMHPDI